MRRKTILVLIFVVAATVAALLLPAPAQRAQAQQGCTEFQAIVQDKLPADMPLRDGDYWGGPIYASLGGQVLLGNISSNDGNTFGHGTTGMGRAGSGKVCFADCTDSFTYEIANAVWPLTPHSETIFGRFIGNTAKIVQGTGRFEYAAGNLNAAGPFIVWTPDGENFYGRWNGEITGNICGVQ